MVNHVTSSLGALKSGDSTKADRVSRQQPAVPVKQSARAASSKEKKQDASQLPVSSHRSQLMQTSAAHQQAAHIESMEKALKDAAEMLEQMRHLGRRMLQAQEGKKKQLQQSLHQLKSRLNKLVNETKYDGEKLVNHDLTPHYRGEKSTSSFSLKGLKIQGWRSQDEVLRFQFDAGKPSSVRARIEAGDTPREVADKLNQALSPREIQVDLDKYGELSFNVDKSRWPEVRHGVWMSGNGQMMPAGNPVKLRAEPHDKQAADVAELEFGKPETTRKALADIERLLQKVQRALQEIERRQTQTAAELERVASSQKSRSVVVNASGNLEMSWLDAPENVSMHLVKNAVPTLLAQANATRQNVVALLEK